MIRWFGSRNGVINGKEAEVKSSDFVVSHSLVTHDNPHYILHDARVNPAFHSRDSRPTVERTLDVTYIGKGMQYGPVDYINNTVYVARGWPVSQEQLALLLRQTRYFYTWDSWTLTNVEAVLCGAIPVMLRYDPYTPEDIDRSELPFPRLDPSQSSLDFAQFVAGKNALEAKLQYYADTWKERTLGFMQAVEKHFAEQEGRLTA